MGDDAIVDKLRGMSHRETDCGNIAAWDCAMLKKEREIRQGCAGLSEPDWTKRYKILLFWRYVAALDKY